MSGPWPIALALSVAIGGLVTAAVLAVLVVQWHSNRINVLELINETVDRTFRSVEVSLEAHLRPAAAQVDYLGRLLDSGGYDPTQQDALADLLAGALAATPQVGAIVFLGHDLEVLGVGQTQDRRPQVFGESTLSPERLQSILTEAREAEGTHWAELVHTSGETFLNVRRPVRRDGTFMGVLTAIVSMPVLSQAMTDIGDTYAATAFILYGQDRLLAHPNLVSPHPDLSPENPAVRIDRVGDLVLSALPEAQALHGFERLRAEGIEVLSVEISGEIYGIFLKTIATYGSTPWRVGSWVALEGRLRQLERLRFAGLAGLAIALIAVVLAVILGRLLARPIRRVAVESTKIGALDLEHVERLPDSAVAELNDQATAFNAMLAGLQSFEKYVPRRLVARLVREDTGSELESGERELTIMFTDIVGFTAMSEQLPAREVADFLNRHFTLLAGCVEAEDGTIDKFIGDALMAFWGAPDRQEDHALRACRAASAAAKAIEADNDARAAAGLDPVRLRVGVHSGPVVVGNIGAPGRINYTIVGDTVNTCQRLESLGREVVTEDAVTVLLSETTARAVTGHVTLEPVGRFEVKGRMQEIQAYRLVP
jgi:class 3 adenylate cyclase